MKLLVGSVLVGAINAVVYMAFEYIVHHGTDYIWRDLFNTDTVRWGVIPLAIALSLLLSIVIKLFGQNRLVKPHLNPIEDNDNKPEQPASVRAMAIIFAIGLVSLLAGASLGPEASLAAISTMLGLWVATQTKLNQAAKLLVASSVGALLVAFFNSLLLILVPVLLIYQAQKNLKLELLLPPALAGLASYAVIQLMGGHAFGSIPAPDELKLVDVITAFILGALCWPIARSLFALIAKSYKFIDRVNKHLPWYVTALTIGLVLGLLYFVGGPTVEFSGNEGTPELVSNSASYSTMALIGLLIVKLLVTGWSLAAGYRGGLVFPSIYVGVALSLVLKSTSDNLSEVGLMVGSIAGIFTALLGSPGVSLVMTASLVPAKLMVLAVSGIAGTILAKKLLQTTGKSA